MTEKTEAKVISRRRAFSILGLAALSLAMAPTVLTVSDAEAQQPSTASGTGTAPKTGATSAPQSGAQRRHERREARRNRRHERREARNQRREERTTGQANRRQQQRGATPPASSTPQQH